MTILMENDFKNASLMLSEVHFIWLKTTKKRGTAWLPA